MRRLICWVGQAAPTEKVASAPPVAGASRAPQGHRLFRKFGKGGWAAEGHWGYQGGQMGQNLPLCAQLGAVRSRHDEPNEVGSHEAGRIRRSSVFEGQGGACRFPVPPDMEVVVCAPLLGSLAMVRCVVLGRRPDNLLALDLCGVCCVLVLGLRTALLLELVHCSVCGRWPACGTVVLYRRCRAYIYAPPAATSSDGLTQARNPK
jgi:hypothetical protein